MIGICPICGKRIELNTHKDFESYSKAEVVEHIKTTHPESYSDLGVPYIRTEHE